LGGVSRYGEQIQKPRRHSKTKNVKQKKRKKKKRTTLVGVGGNKKSQRGSNGGWQKGQLWKHPKKYTKKHANRG